MRRASCRSVAVQLLVAFTLFALGVLSRPGLARLKAELESHWAAATSPPPTPGNPDQLQNAAKANNEYLSVFCERATIQWPKNQTLTIVCHGHSVPAGYFNTPDVRTFDAYPHLIHVALGARFPSAVINVVVTAIGGEDSASGAERFERDVLSLRPDVVTIDYGLNDRRIGLEAAREAWISMIEQAQRQNIKVILLTPTPDMSAQLSNPSDPLNEHAVQIRALATTYQVALVDSLAVFAENLDSGVALSTLMSVQNHPNRAGHELVASALLKWFPAPL